MYKAEMYAEYLEFCLTFVMNIVNKEYNSYYSFSLEKFQVVTNEFPLESAYYYIANNLLKAEETEQFKRILGPFLELFPNGELNERIKTKFNEVN